MSNKILTCLTQKLMEQRGRKRGQVLLALLIIAVLGVTMFILIKPAIALMSQEDRPDGVHYHTVDCYDWDAEPGEWMNYLYCNAERLGIHEHTSYCFEEDKDGNLKLVCGIADYVIHRHSRECYDRDGSLVCGLSECLPLDADEGYVHEHTAECYLPDSFHYVKATASNADEIANNADEIANNADEDIRLAEHDEESEGQKATASSAAGKKTETSGNAGKKADTGKKADGRKKTNVGKSIASISNADLEDLEDLAELPELCLTGCLICGLEAADVDEIDFEDEDLEEYIPDEVELIDDVHRHITPVRSAPKEGVLHEHGRACYENGIRICGLLQTEEHIHGEECYVTAPPLLCEESGVHIWEQDAETDYDREPQEFNADEATAIAVLAGSASAEDMEWMLQDLPMAIDEDEMEAADVIDFAEWITDITIQKRPNEWALWEDLGDSSVEDGDILRFKTSYIIPGGQLDYENRTISYQLPQNMGEATNADEGTVYNDSGQAIGTYLIDGTTVSITFYDMYVARNMNGQAIDGFIAFTASVNKMQFEDGQLGLDFKEDLKVDLILGNQTPEEKNLSVTKIAPEDGIDRENGTLNYVITVSSKNGTDDVVTLKDVMSKVEADSEIVVMQGENDITDSAEMILTNSGFEMVLPKMGAGDTYTITYSAKLSQELENGSVTAKNSISVESTDRNGKVIGDSQNISTTFAKYMLQKSGSRNSDGTITWKIVVGTTGQDLKGYTIHDDFAGGLQDISITAKTADGQTISIPKFPYEFTENVTGPVEITYVTEGTAQLGENTVSNTAELWKDGEQQASSTGSAGIGSPVYNPLKKTAGGISGEYGNTVILNWNAVIDFSKLPSNQELPDQWYYEDSLMTGQAAQYFTKDQLAAIREDLEERYPGLTFTIVGKKPDGSEISLDAMSNTAVTAFRITFEQNPGDGAANYDCIEFSYQSTGEVDGSSVNFWNSAKLNDKWTLSSQAKNPYRPVVEKQDALTNSSEDSSHGYQDEALSEQIQSDEDRSVETVRGILQWKIIVTLPEESEGEFTIAEKLPEDVSLYGLKFLLDNKETPVNLSGWPKPAAVSVDGETIRITAMENGEIHMVLPDALAGKLAGKSLIIHVRAKIDETKMADHGTVLDFRNTVEIRNEKNDSIGSASQKQTITNDVYHDVISKSYSGRDTSVTFENNTITYRIEVNPNGLDLISGRGADEDADLDHLKLQDTMTRWYDPSNPITGVLVMDSLKVYRRNSDGTRGTLIDCPYTYVPENEKGTATSHGWYCYDLLEITIPDETPLIIEYQYKFNGTPSTPNQANWLQPENTAKLLWDGEPKESSTGGIYFTIQESNAGADTGGVTVYKHDLDHVGTGLQGARFKLYRYELDEEGNGDYREVLDKDANGTERELIFVSDENGLFSIYDPEKTGTSGFRDLTPDQAYKLVEVSAPDGYLSSGRIIEFYVNGGAGVKIKPEDSEVQAVNSGDVLYYSNQKIPVTTIGVHKQWRYSDGTPVTDKSGNIRFKLYQVQTAGGGTSEDAADGVSYTIRGAYSWQGSVSGKMEDVRVGDTIRAVIRLSYGNAWWYPAISVDGADVLSPKEGSSEGWSTTDVNIYQGEWKIASSEIEIEINENIMSNLSSFTWEKIASGADPDDDSQKTPSSGVLYGTYVIGSATNWNWSKSDLPLTGVDDDGNPVSYKYYVEEVNNENYIVTYEPEESISSGDIVITNTSDVVYTLPETGGHGTLPYTAGGLMLMLTAAGALMYRQNADGRTASGGCARICKEICCFAAQIRRRKRFNQRFLRKRDEGEKL